MSITRRLRGRHALKGKTAAQWTSENPRLLPGEPGLESDTGLVKYGNQARDRWNDLDYPPGGDVPDATPVVKGKSLSSKAPLVAGSPTHVETSEAVYTEGIKTVYLSDHGNSFSTAVTAIGSNVRILKITGTVNHSGSLIIPKNIFVDVDAQAMVNVTSGNLRFRRLAKNPGNRQWLNVSSGAHVYFDEKPLDEPVSPAWYVGSDGPAANRENFDAAIDDLMFSVTGASGAKIYIPANYYTYGGKIFPNGITITSFGSHPDAATGGGFTLHPDSPNDFIFKVPTGARSIVLRDMILDSGDVAGARGIACSPESGVVYGVTMDHVSFRNGDYGFDNDDPSGNNVEIEGITFTACYFWNNKIAGIRTKTARNANISTGAVIFAANN